MSTTLVGILVGVLVGAAWWWLRPDSGERLDGLLGRGAAGVREPGRESTGRVPGGVRGDGGAYGNGSGGRGAGGGGAVDREALAFDLELAAICLRTGLPTERALALAAGTNGDRSGLGRLGNSVALGRQAPKDDALAEVARLIVFSRRTGVALAPLLQGLAVDMRRSEQRRRQVAAARLGVRLVVPLGVCILPAFVLMGILPVVITLVDDMSSLFGGGAG